MLEISNPDKVFFAARGRTKDWTWSGLHLAVGEGVMKGLVEERPTVLKRFPNGAEGPFFFQKAGVPENRPEWLQTVTIHFPSGRSAEELCPTDVAHVIWAVNLGCLELNPWPVRRTDVDHPDELRVDLDPQPGVTFDSVRKVAMEVRQVLGEHQLVEASQDLPISRGIHINVPIALRAGSSTRSAGQHRPWRARCSGDCQIWPPLRGGRSSAASAPWSTTTKMPGTGP